MTLALSAPMAAETAEHLTQPGWLLEIGGTNRLCSLGDATFMALAWFAAPFDIASLAQDGKLADGGRITFRDVDGLYTALMLTGGLSNQSARIWICDRGAAGVADPVLRFDGTVDAPSCDWPRRTVTAQLIPTRPGARRIPRQIYGPALGMATALPAGAVLAIGNTAYTVKR